MTRSLLKSIICIFVLSGCVNTYIEEKASLEFEPIYPAQEFDKPNRNVNGSIYAQAGGGLFATDRRAQHVGDILTVNLSEQFSAKKAQSATSGKTDGFEVTVPLGLQNNLGTAADLTAGTKQSFSGSGGATQSNSLTGKISVTVIRLLDNGNLEIMGQKKLTLNNGNEYIRLSGVIRPEDISASNEVSSNRIAHASITYTGTGDVHDTNQPGWLGKALRVVSPF
jgi:flagellar L-ring protein precursor FlgH